MSAVMHPDGVRSCHMANSETTDDGTRVTTLAQILLNGNNVCMVKFPRRSCMHALARFYACRKYTGHLHTLRRTYRQKHILQNRAHRSLLIRVSM